MKHKIMLTFVCTIAVVLLFAEGAAAVGECDCEMTPSTTTITRGKKLEIDVTVTNNTGQAGMVKFGSKVTKPDGTTTGYIYGPVEFGLAASGQKSGHISLSVPTDWSMGTYTYHAYVGNYGNLYGECEFEFVVAMGVPKTGQTNSYATGDDGDLQKGTEWPNPRFTDNGNGTVTDNLTGLIWLKNANCFGTRDWATALADCNSLADLACGLSDGSIAGDWRLPNRSELLSLLDLGQYNPALPSGHPFMGVPLPPWTYYWSATTLADLTDDAWGVDMDYGYGSFDVKSSSHYVWPVRAGQ